VFLRVAAALVVASRGLAALEYTIPGLYLWRGVSTLAVIFTGLGVRWRGRCGLTGSCCLAVGAALSSVNAGKRQRIQGHSKSNSGPRYQLSLVRLY